MASARAREDLTSQNYSIEDKNMRDMDDKYANRREDRYNGPTSKFSEKEGELKFSRINPIRNSILLTILIKVPFSTHYNLRLQTQREAGVCG